MVSSVVYQVTAPVKNLPPRQIRVISITTNPTSINFIQQWGEICLDVEITNSDGATASVFINDEIAYLLNGGNSKAHEEVVVQAMTVSNITSGFVIAHVLKVNLLQRLGALEVR